MNWVRYLTFCGAVFTLTISLVASVGAQAVSISDSVNITAVILTDTVNTPPIPNSQNNGPGGVMLNAVPSDSALFKGLAYPGSIVSLLQNGSVVAEVPANPDGTFEIKVQGVLPGSYTFGIRAEDVKRIRSALQVFSIAITQGSAITVDGIFIPPTITTDKSEVKKGDPILLFGSAAPNAKISISIHSLQEILKNTTSNGAGGWSFKLDSNELALGPHDAKARTIRADGVSLFSDAVTFTVGTLNRPRVGSLTGNKRCDINNDGRVNLLDFSILAFWYKRTGFPDKVDLNTDKRVDLSDVSILAYCWTG